MRAFLIVFHRWLALGFSLVLIVVSVTGALMVFEGTLAARLAQRVPVGAAPLSLDTLATHAISAAGGRVSAIDFGQGSGEAYGFQVDRDTSSQDMMVDPYTGRVLGAASLDPPIVGIARNVHVLHTSLLAGDNGKRVVAFATLGALLLVLTGLILWWRERTWRVRWSASWKRVVFDLHHALGAAASLVLLVIAATGAWIAFPGQIDPLVLRLDRSAAPQGPPRELPHDSLAVAVAFDALVLAARAEAPGAPVRRMLLPLHAPAMIALRYPEDHTPGGRSRVFVDRYRGSVVRATNTRTAELGTKLMTLQRSLHTGDVFGWPSRIIWFLAAVVLGSQVVTGVLMWWNGRAARAVRRGK